MGRKKELLERRRKLFSRLAEVLESDNKADRMLYIFDLWKYIADVHGEDISIEVEM